MSTEFEQAFEEHLARRKGWQEQALRSPNTPSGSPLLLSGTAYTSALLPLFAQEATKLPFFLQPGDAEFEALCCAELIWRVGDYVLFPSLLWLCAARSWTEIRAPTYPFDLSDLVKRTGGFRLLLYHRSAMDIDAFLQLRELPDAPAPELTRVGVPFTYLDLDSFDLDRLRGAEHTVRQWLGGVWREPVESFFHIPAPQSPKHVLHLHLVAGAELDLEYANVCYRVPLHQLNAYGPEPPFVVDVARWQREDLAADLVQQAARHPITIGIAGASGSGKSRLAAALAKEFAQRGHGVFPTLSLDDYVKTTGGAPRLPSAVLDILPPQWPRNPNALDRMHPRTFSFANLRSDLQEHLEPSDAELRPVLLVEGHLLTHDRTLVNMLDYVIYIGATGQDKPELMRRRMRRRRGDDLPAPLEQGITEEQYRPYHDRVWCCHELFGSYVPPRALVLPFDQPTEEQVRAVCAALPVERWRTAPAALAT